MRVEIYCDGYWDRIFFKIKGFWKFVESSNGCYSIWIIVVLILDYNWVIYNSNIVL